MASQPDVIQHCLHEASSASRPALEHAIDTAIAALQAAEDKAQKMAERDELANAYRHLIKYKPAWCARFPADLLAAFAEQTAAAAKAALAARVDGKAVAKEADVLAPARAAPASGKKAGASGRGIEAFSLVDDDDVAQAIESSRLLQLLLPPVEQALAELDSLISSAQGLPNVMPELNPLRPAIFAQVVQSLMSSNAADRTVFSLAVRHLADPLARELQKIYKRVIQQLELANVHAAHYRVLQTPASASKRAARKDGKPGDAGHDGKGGKNGNGEGGNAQGKQPSQYADLSNYEIRDELFQDFLFHGGSNASQRLAPSYYARVDEELAELHATPESSPAPLHDAHHHEEAHYQSVPAVDRPPRFVDVLSQLSSQVWGAYGRSRERAMVRTQLRKEATQVGQVLGLEVVRKLVNQVAQDPRLLVPVREAIVALEPSLLRLAMVDPRFFSDEGHPGRRLMERVAQRSFKYNDEYSLDFKAFFGPVRQTFIELNKLQISDVKPFGTALAQLEYAWDAQDQEEQANRHHVLKALRFAEERQEQADRIAFDLSSRADLDSVSGVVLDFLFGPWALAMAHARLTDDRNQVDPHGFGSVVPDLLWSVKRDVTLKRPAKLIEMIPGLLDKLHQGLDLLGQDPRENERFFDSLMKLHRPVLKLRRLKTLRDAEESGAMPLEPELLEAVEGPEDLPATAEQRRARAAEQPWLGRDDLDAAGFEDTLPTAPGELAYLDDDYSDGRPPAALSPEAEDAAAALRSTTDVQQDAGKPGESAETKDARAEQAAMTREEAGAVLDHLRTGSWVDLYSRREWLRAQLIWASTKGTLFMFVSHGGQPHSMTRRSCEKLIVQRLLRPVDTHGVVAKALDKVETEVANAAPPVAQGEAETA